MKKFKKKFQWKDEHVTFPSERAKELDAIKNPVERFKKYMKHVSEATVPEAEHPFIMNQRGASGSYVPGSNVALHRKLVKEALDHYNKVGDNVESKHTDPEGKKSFSDYKKSQFYHSVKNYKDQDYEAINSNLRSNRPIPSTHKEIASDLHGLTSQPTEHDFKTYRGFGEDSHRLKDMKPGDTLHDKGFVSTTIDKNVGLNFALDPTRSDYHIARIHIKPGNKGHYLDAHWHNKNDKQQYPNAGEGEYLIHPGTTFKKVGEETHKDPGGTDVTYHDLEIHHQRD